MSNFNGALKNNNFVFDRFGLSLKSSLNLRLDRTRSFGSNKGAVRTGSSHNNPLYITPLLDCSFGDSMMMYRNPSRHWRGPPLSLPRKGSPLGPFWGLKRLCGGGRCANILNKDWRKVLLQLKDNRFTNQKDLLCYGSKNEQKNFRTS